MQQSTGSPILIAGAGIGGLTLAIALRRAGFAVTVVERAAALAEFGSGITLRHNALHCLDKLGVGESIRAVGQKAETGVLALSNGRRLVQAAPTDELQAVADLMTFHRAELQQALYEQLPPGTVRFGASCAGYTVAEDHVDVNLQHAGSTVHDETGAARRAANAEKHSVACHPALNPRRAATKADGVRRDECRIGCLNCEGSGAVWYLNT